jgi:hypothetical protein
MTSATADGVCTSTLLPVSGTACANGTPFSVPCVLRVTAYEPAVKLAGTYFESKVIVAVALPPGIAYGCDGAALYVRVPSVNVTP